ncbi:tumor necrosis factor receptor superfamily member 21-like [Seriola dumerili]|uniref:tumor necrosis factor receptor superfamily member 21-like n=1 Tax=Seriola dumerili TaxID=41447 RepID=UPI000BBE9552|nr:tumor necrosis factor receptor superfamily member 21-like [Seriola dumerili]
MFPLECSLVVLYALSIWTIGYAKVNCGDQQVQIEQQCCDKCPPGKYVKEFCTEHKKTLCSPCNDGFFSNQYSIFDRCEECQSCPYGYAEKCTPITDAKCSCPPGFLCSNNVCSACEENKHVTQEKLNMTDYLCPENAYFDAKNKICKPWTQCSAIGLAELFPGNQTHDSVCLVLAAVHSSDGEHIHVILGISFGLVSLSLLVFLCYACTKSLRKLKANNYPVLVTSTNTGDFHLSKEESGLQFIIQDESKDSNTFGELHVGKVTFP